VTDDRRTVLQEEDLDEHAAASAFMQSAELADCVLECLNEGIAMATSDDGKAFDRQMQMFARVVDEDREIFRALARGPQASDAVREAREIAARFMRESLATTELGAALERCRGSLLEAIERIERTRDRVAGVDDPAETENARDAIAWNIERASWECALAASHVAAHLGTTPDAPFDAFGILAGGPGLLDPQLAAAMERAYIWRDALLYGPAAGDRPPAAEAAGIGLDAFRAFADWIRQRQAIAELAEVTEDLITRHGLK